MGPEELDPEEAAVRAEVERRTGRSFQRVQEQLQELFGLEWEQIEIAISTAADRKHRTEADVIVDLVAKADAQAALPSSTRVRRAVIRWIGKPWRERQDPWERYRERVRELRDLGPPPPTTGEGEPWEPLRPQ